MVEEEDAIFSEGFDIGECNSSNKRFSWFKTIKVELVDIFNWTLEVIRNRDIILDLRVVRWEDRK
jgi:hypothetical protein